MIEARAHTLIVTMIFSITVGGSPAAAANDSPRFSIVHFSRNYTC